MVSSHFGTWTACICKSGKFWPVPCFDGNLHEIILRGIWSMSGIHPWLAGDRTSVPITRSAWHDNHALSSLPIGLHHYGYTISDWKLWGRYAHSRLNLSCSYQAQRISSDIFTVGRGQPQASLESGIEHSMTPSPAYGHANAGFPCFDPGIGVSNICLT